MSADEPPCRSLTTPESPSFFLPRHEFVDQMNAHRLALQIAVQTVENNARVTSMALKEATDKATNAIDRRLESMNEFRMTLNDQASSMITRTEYSAQHKAVVDRIDANTIILNSLVGRNVGGAAVWAYVAGAIVMLLSFVSLLVHFKVQQ